MWYLYILKCSDGTYYTGVARNLEKRLSEHNHSNKGAKYTRARRPVELIYSSKHRSRSNAQTKESRIKAMTRAEKINYIKNEVSRLNSKSKQKR